MSDSSGFYPSFQRRRNDLVDQMSLTDLSSASNEEVLKELSLHVQQLRKDTVEATAYLPAHDRKTLEKQLADLESRLQKMRQQSSKKGRFLFKKLGSGQASSQTGGRLSIPPPSELLVQTSCADDKPVQRFVTRNQHITSVGSVDNVNAMTSSELTLTDMDGCVIDLLRKSPDTERATMTTLQIKSISNSLLILGIVNGSVMLHDLERCIVVLKCHQLRIHSSRNLVIYLDVPSSSSGIIEGCSAITFANIPRDFRESIFNTSDELPTTQPIIQDFSHIMTSTSPNWRFVADEEAQKCLDLGCNLKDTIGIFGIKAFLERFLPSPLAQ